MLVEIVDSNTTSTNNELAIPLGLIHRIVAEGWQESATNDNVQTMKLSTDARRVLGRYVDTFVREAVARCAYEANERDGRADGNGEEVLVGRQGWVDVDDLERVAGVLCLDF